MNILMNAWSYFATNILQQPAWMIGLIVLVGYVLLKKPWYDVLGGTLKAVIGYMILAVGSGGLVNNFRPVLVGLGERFNLNAMVIDPYFGQKRGNRRCGRDVWKILFTGYDSSASCVYHQYSSGSLPQDYEASLPVHHRTRTGTAGFYRLLADSVRSSGTSDKQYCASDCHGSCTWSVLGSRFQPDHQTDSGTD